MILRSKVTIFSILITVSIVPLVNSGCVTKASLNRILTQLLDTRDDLIDIVKKLEFRKNRLVRLQSNLPTLMADVTREVETIVDDATLMAVAAITVVQGVAKAIEQGRTWGMILICFQKFFEESFSVIFAIKNLGDQNHR